MGISIWHLLIVLGIVILIFGTKKLKNMGGDIGGAVKSFKSAMKDDADKAMKKNIAEDNADVIDAEVKTKDNNNAWVPGNRRVQASCLMLVFGRFSLF